MAMKYFKTKRICGRIVDTFIIDEFKKPIKKFAGDSSAHIIVPRIYTEREAELRIIVPKPFVCKRCVETITYEKYFSPDPRLCNRCYEATEFLKKNRNKLKCEKCNIKISEREYKQHWDRQICGICWEKEADEKSKMGDYKPINKSLIM